MVKNMASKGDLPSAHAERSRRVLERVDDKPVHHLPGERVSAHAHGVPSRATS